MPASYLTRKAKCSGLFILHHFSIAASLPDMKEHLLCVSLSYSEDITGLFSFFLSWKPEIWSNLVARSSNVFKGVKPSLLHSNALVFNPEHKSVSEISETVWQLCCVGGKCKSQPLKLSVIADISYKWWMIRLKVLNSMLEISTTCNMSQFNNAANKMKATICLGARIH